MKAEKIMVLFRTDDTQMQHNFSCKKPHIYLTGKGIELKVNVSAAVDLVKDTAFPYELCN